MKTVKDYNLPLNSLKQQQHEKYALCYFPKFVPTLSKQSKAQHNMGAGNVFFAHQTI